MQVSKPPSTLKFTKALGNYFTLWICVDTFNAMYVGIKTNIKEMTQNNAAKRTAEIIWNKSWKDKPAFPLITWCFHRWKAKEKALLSASVLRTTLIALENDFCLKELRVNMKPFKMYYKKVLMYKDREWSSNSHILTLLHI